MKKIMFVFFLLSSLMFSMESFKSNDKKVTINYDERSWEIKTIDGVRGLVPKGAYKYAMIFISDYRTTPVQGKEILAEIKKEILKNNKVIGEINVKEEKDKTQISYKISKDDKNYNSDTLIIGDFFGYYEIKYVALEENYGDFRNEAIDILETGVYEK